MKPVKIEHSKHPLYLPFKELYAASFPVFEQRTEQQQERAFHSFNYHLIGYEEEGVFIGFISYWEFEGYHYIEHFAVNADLRGKGYGSKILQSFLHSTEKIVLLEIDPIIDDVSKARLRFYGKCGFYENPYRHVHPAYRTGYEAHPLVVLTTQRQITDQEYQIFNKELAETVMNGK